MYVQILIYNKNELHLNKRIRDFFTYIALAVPCPIVSYFFIIKTPILNQPLKDVFLIYFHIFILCLLSAFSFVKGIVQLLWPRVLIFDLTNKKSYTGFLFRKKILFQKELSDIENILKLTINQFSNKFYQLSLDLKCGQRIVITPLLKEEFIQSSEFKKFINDLNMVFSAVSNQGL